ncbi:IPT/TIG domain-containing protein [Streptomyces sp. NPDC048434]|uniref:IPT/TIG domain-containing protein n=1 Tax=Streptomyces sp. NPDC048434 TaxID=3365549 RepID=UPI00371CC916
MPARRSRHYLRVGTTTLFAVLEAATSKVIGSLHRRTGLPSSGSPRQGPQGSPRRPTAGPAPVVVSAVTPSTGKAGTQVTIDGSGFVPGAAVRL